MSRIPVHRAESWEEAAERYRALLVTAIEDLDDTSWTITGRLSMRARSLRAAMVVVDPCSCAARDKVTT